MNHKTLFIIIPTFEDLCWGESLLVSLGFPRIISPDKKGSLFQKEYHNEHSTVSLFLRE